MIRDRSCLFVVIASLMFIFSMASPVLLAQEAGHVLGSAAEWLPAKSILVHTPGQELFYGVIHPAAALFERPFSSTIAAREHRAYLDQFRDQGVTVTQLKDAVLLGTIDPSGAAVEGPQLERLQEFAFQFITIEHDETLTSEQQAARSEFYFRDTFCKLHPEELWQTIILNPKVTLRSTGELNTGVVADYQVRPVMNLYFMRDQIITTGKGVVLGRMNSEQRFVETEIVKFALNNLKIEPVAQISDPGRLEGGDFLPAGKRVFIGQGLRTNDAAIQQLLDADAFGSEEVVVVKDPWQQQAQMHLDTYFNILSPKLAVLAQNRITGSDQAPTVDVYRKIENRYKLLQTKTDFQAYLKESGMQVIEVSREDQLNYGCNFLTVRENEIFLVEGVSEHYLSRLKSSGVKVHLVDFHNLTGGYGACHCTVQVLLRSAQ